jgi:LacI family transcriptional regulator
MGSKSPSGKTSSFWPTIHDVANRAGVSPGSVSNVLNGRRPNDDDIGKAVLDAVRELGYRPNVMASNLRRSDSSIVGVIIPDFTNPFFAGLVAALEECAHGQGYRIVAVSSRQDASLEEREVRALLGWRIAGLLVAPALDSMGELFRRLDVGVPLVIVNRVFEEHDLDCIDLDHCNSARDVMNEFITAGHRRIVIVHPSGGDGIIAERLDGIRSAVNSAVDVDVEFLVCDGDFEDVQKATRARFVNDPMPTGVLALDAVTTMAVLDFTCRQPDRMVPGFPFAGFDTSGWMASMLPGMTSIAQPVRDVAINAWKRLMSRIDGETGPRVVVKVPYLIDGRERLSPRAPN